MSPRARTLLEAYRRERTPDRETLARARDAIAERLRSAVPSADEQASPKLDAPRLSRFRAWAYGSAALTLAGLSLLPARPPPSSPHANGREHAAVRAPDASATAHPPRPQLAATADIRDAGAERLAVGDAFAPAPSVPRRGARRRTLPSGEPPPPKETFAPSAAPESGTSDDSAARGPAFEEASTTAASGGEPSITSAVVPAPTSADRTAIRSAEVVNATEQPDDELTLDAELMQVRTAYERLRAGEPLRALSALDEHTRRFPRAKLRELADVARVLALCDLGKVRVAESASARFLMEHPGSIHAPRVRAACGADR